MSSGPASPPFTPQTLRFLRGLARHNDREWFEARRDVYERAVRAPMLALVEAVNAEMDACAPEHVRPPHKTMMRIFRDTRFSPDKRPYKRQVSAWWGKRGSVRTTGAGFYLHVKPDEVLLAAGVFRPEREQVLALRQWLAENHATFRKHLRTLAKEAKGSPGFAAAEDEHPLVRMPKGFPADHPASDLLRAASWGVSLRLPAADALETNFAIIVARAFRRAAPLVLALDEALEATVKPAPAGLPGSLGRPAAWNLD